MEPATSAFADWVNATARGLGYRTDAQLAGAIGVQQSTITRWRQGAQPQIKHLVELARLFKMRIDPLLAMSGHVPPDLLGDARPSGPPVTESVHRIRAAQITDESRKLLFNYWDDRLSEERARLYLLIEWIADVEREGPGTRETLIGSIADLLQSDLEVQVMQLLFEIAGVETRSRKRRRRVEKPTPQQELLSEPGGEDG
ncbi:helix-turn-helix domain-containing protein [Sphaerisporangium sp. NPDC004334]